MFLLIRLSTIKIFPMVATRAKKKNLPWYFQHPKYSSQVKMTGIKPSQILIKELNIKYTYLDAHLKNV